MKKAPWLKNKKFSKRLWVVVLIFAAAGAYIVFQSFATNKYNPYNPPSEAGIATYYDNAVVGGRGHCAAIHYSRGRKLKVTNKKRGNELYDTSITCIVSDAGPFGNGRVVDLNTDDFKKLAGSNSAGVLRVRLELVTKPEHPPACAPTVTQNDDGAWSVNRCEPARTATPVEPDGSEPDRNAFEVVYDYVKGAVGSILDIFR
jgi:hypothetical protein